MWIIATEGAVRYQRKAKSPGELAYTVSQGMNKLNIFVQRQPVSQDYQSDSDEESDNAATTTDSEGPVPQRGRRKQKGK